MGEGRAFQTMTSQIKQFLRRSLTPIIRLNAKRRILEYLRNNPHAQKKLHCGCGTNLPEGWLNTDIGGTGVFCRPRVLLDVTEPLPIPSSSLDYVFSEHMVEHIPLEKTRHFLAEAYRVLKPGGVIRTTFPCLEFLIDLYQSDEERARPFLEAMEKDVIHAGFVSRALAINAYYHTWDHQVIFDFPLFSKLLEEAGFRDPAKQGLGQSDFAALKGIELRGRGTRVYDIESPYAVEARK
jgi:predicted SAM-dependent methyltransferase